MKKFAAAALCLVLMLPALAMAASSVLLVELPEDAQMIENVEFDDGDFIQTYQMEGGVRVQLLRYASFEMTLGDLIASEWVGCTDVRELPFVQTQDSPVQGLRFSHQEEGQQALDVMLITVQAGDCVLVLQATYPKTMGEAQIDAAMQAIIDSMRVSSAIGEPADENADVG